MVDHLLLRYIKLLNGFVDTINSTGTLNLVANSEGKRFFKKRMLIILILQEGALVQETGDFAATEGVKSIKLIQGPVVDGSVQVFITAVLQTIILEGAYTEVENIYFASGINDKIFQVIYE
jgi:hypothetical protein